MNEINFPEKFYNYYESYRATGVSLLITSILRDLTIGLDMLSIIDKGTFRHYWKNDIAVAKKAFDICSNEKEFEKYIGLFYTIKDSIRQFCDPCLSKDLLITKDVEDVIELFQKIGDFYVVIDFDDEGYQWLHQNLSEEGKKRLEKLQSLKNDARAELITPVLGSEISFFNKLVRKMATQLHLDEEILGWYTIEECREAFNNFRVGDNRIEQRKDAVLVYTYKQRKSYIEGTEARNIINNLSKNKGQDIKGVVAYKSNHPVRGKAKIFKLDYNDSGKLSRFISDFKEGEILVAEVTSPELLPAMKIASAIVTDFGGMMTHAAIISREFKIPCIVNTREATQKITEGMFIEVNTETGVVRVL